MDILVGSRLGLGEGARSLGGHLHYVDLLGGLLYRWDGAASEVLRSGQPVGVAAPIAGCPSRVLVAEGTGISVYDTGGAESRRVWQRELAESGPQHALRVNDGSCDPLGRFWVGTMPWADDGPPGSVYLTGVQGLEVVLDGIACPNGPAFTTDGTVYLADTVGQVVLRSRVDLKTGVVAPFAPFATVDGGLPDGMTVDDEGCLWVAVWGAGEVRRYDPAGRLRSRHETGARQPTSVCLLPIDGQPHAVVTTARIGLAEPTERDGAVLAFAVDETAPPASAWVPPDWVEPEVLS